MVVFGQKKAPAGGRGFVPFLTLLLNYRPFRNTPMPTIFGCFGGLSSCQDWRKYFWCERGVLTASGTGIGRQESESQRSRRRRENTEVFVRGVARQLFWGRRA